MDKIPLSSLARSSLCPKAIRLRPAVLCFTIVFAASALPAGSSLAAQTYFEPQIDLRIENNDNFDLVPGGSPDSDVYGYIANLQAHIGIATPRSETWLRPRLRLQQYPERKDLQRTEAFLDLHSEYEWQRSNFLFIGGYSLEDVYNADTASGVIDPDNPGGSGNPNSARTVYGETRSLLDLRPKFEYEITERVRVGADADYQIARYNADGDVTNTDYDYSVLNGFVTWALNPTSDFTVGAYASRFETQDASAETDAIGGRLGYDYRWSETTGVEATLFYERNDITEFDPVRLEERTTGWGGYLTAYREYEVTTWRLALGKTFTPTGDKGKSQSQEIRLQYDRDLSERLSLRGVARYDVQNPLGDTTNGGQDRDYARMDVSLKWFMSPTWYVGGGYTYIWEHRAEATGDASNNKLFVNFGYQALSQRGR